MTQFRFFFLVILLSLSCAGIPTLSETECGTAGLNAIKFDAPFQKGSWRFVHSIDGKMSGWGQISLTGVSIISQRTKSIHAVLLTLEGLVLLDAEYGGLLKINRAVPPFDSKAFAQGMIDDIRLALISPPGRHACGSRGNKPVYRFVSENHTTDLSALKKDNWLLSYYVSGSLKRKLVFSHKDEKKIFHRINLDAYGTGGYSLQMELISAEHLAP